VFFKDSPSLLHMSSPVCSTVKKLCCGALLLISIIALGTEWGNLRGLWKELTYRPQTRT
jgi:hypothetical protein